MLRVVFKVKSLLVICGIVLEKRQDNAANNEIEKSETRTLLGRVNVQGQES